MTRLTRRQVLRAALGAGAGVALGWPNAVRSASSLPPEEDRKLVVVLFGGGTRSSESIDDPEHRYIPRLWKEMIPHGTLFTNMRVEHKVVHPNSAGSIVTGHWEWDDIDWSRPVEYPSIFEIYRKERGAPDTSAWAFVYASILAMTGVSRDEGYGTRYAANVVEPPTIPRSTSDEMDTLLRAAASTGSVDEEMKAAAECARLARSTSRIATSGLRSDVARKFADGEYQVWKSGSGTTSHDAFLTDRAIACMRRFAPSVLAV